jgi:hypothetical protein
MENNDLHYIINRHSATTDGYRVLYEIMQRQHPKLNPDIKFKAPVSKEYADVHEYYNYVTAYFLHEKYSGRNYMPREQINQFLEGLDSTYGYAIKRIKGLMDTWNIKDTNVPDNLRMENLPIKVDDYMEEDAGTPVIHRIEKQSGGKYYHERKHRDQLQDNEKPSDDQRRQYIDSQCPLCKSFGHPKQHCDRRLCGSILKKVLSNSMKNPRVSSLLTTHQ